MAATDKGVWDLQEVRDKQLASEWEYTIAEELWMWGLNNSGQLGQNSLIRHSSPVQIPGNNWDTVYSQTYSIAATKTDGTLWVSGTNNTGQLGLNNQTNLSSPTQLPGDWGTGAVSYTHLTLPTIYSV